MARSKRGSEQETWIPKVKEASINDDFDFDTFVTNNTYDNKTILGMMEISSLIKKGTYGKAEEVFLLGMEIEGDTAGRDHIRFEGENPPYHYKTITKFLQDQDIFTAFEDAITFSEGFGVCIARILYGEVPELELEPTEEPLDPDDDTVDTIDAELVKKEPIYDEIGSAVEIIYPLADGTGFEIMDYDPKTKEPKMFKLHSIVPMGEQPDPEEVPADQFVIFKSRKHNAKWGGKSQILDLLPVGHLQILYHVALAGVMDNAHTSIYETLGIKGSDAKTYYTALGDHLKLIKKNVLPPTVDTHGEFVSPTNDGTILASTQEQILTEAALALEIAKSQLGLDDAGVRFAGGEGRIFSARSIRKLQRRYTKPIEDVLRMLGFDTTITWPEITDPTLEGDPNNENGDEEGENSEESDETEEDVNGNVKPAKGVNDSQKN